MKDAEPRRGLGRTGKVVLAAALLAGVLLMVLAALVLPAFLRSLAAAQSRDPAAISEAGRQKLARLSPEKDPAAWAEAQHDLGNALYRQARASSGEAASQLTAEAVAAYRAAAAADPRPRGEFWAVTQENLSIALTKQARGSTDAAAAAGYRKEAVVAVRQAIAVYDRLGMKANQATAETGLGLLLHQLGIDANGPEAALLLGESVAAHRSALAILDPRENDRRQDWAEAQVNLGMALEAQATRASSAEEAAGQLSAAVDAFHEALLVLTREATPEHWARTQVSLQMALSRQASRVATAEEAPRLFAEAKEALRAAQEVFTRESAPDNWAICRNNLASVLTEEGLRSSGDEAARLFAEAVAASRDSLEVWPRETQAQNWADAQITLGNALLGLGRQRGGSEGAELLEQAEAAQRGALAIHTREAAPQRWAMAKNDLGEVLLAQGKPADLEEALAAFRAALAVRSPDGLPWLHLESRRNEAAALEALGRKEEAAAVAAKIAPSS